MRRSSGWALELCRTDSRCQTRSVPALRRRSRRASASSDEFPARGSLFRLSSRRAMAWAVGGTGPRKRARSPCAIRSVGKVSMSRSPIAPAWSSTSTQLNWTSGIFAACATSWGRHSRQVPHHWAQRQMTCQPFRAEGGVSPASCGWRSEAFIGRLAASLAASQARWSR